MRPNCRIKIAFVQIFRQILLPYLGLNYELMRVCMYVCMHACMYVCMHVCLKVF